jgi:hypothetical protein
MKMPARIGAMGIATGPAAAPFISPPHGPAHFLAGTQNGFDPIRDGV